MADRMGTWKIKCSITTGGGPFARGPRTSVSFQKKKPKKTIKQKKQPQVSHNLLNAVTFQAASTSLLLHLAGRAVAHPPAVGVASGGRELHVLLVDPWEHTQTNELASLLCHPAVSTITTDVSANEQVSMEVPSWYKILWHPRCQNQGTLPDDAAPGNGDTGGTRWLCSGYNPGLPCEQVAARRQPLGTQAASSAAL